MRISFRPDNVSIFPIKNACINNVRTIQRINPVIGCFEPPRSNPLEGMTEEQKEYEVLQLVNLVDKLTR